MEGHYCFPFCQVANVQRSVSGPGHRLTAVRCDCHGSDRPGVAMSRHKVPNALRVIVVAGAGDHVAALTGNCYGMYPAGTALKRCFGCSPAEFMGMPEGSKTPLYWKIREYFTAGTSTGALPCIRTIQYARRLRPVVWAAGIALGPGLCQFRYRG